MSRACLLAFAFAVSAVAAPVPKETEAERIGKAFGTVTEPTGCKLSLDAKDVLTVKLEKAKPKKDTKPDEGFGALPQASGVSFARTVKGEFSATVRFQLKTDLAERPDDTGGISVGLSVEYPTGESAGISRSINLGKPLVSSADMQPVRMLAGTGSHTSTGKDGGFQGRSGGAQSAGDGPLQLRIRCVGKKLLLEHQPSGDKWETYDSLTIKDAGEAKLTLSAFSFHGGATELVLDKFEVK